MAKVGPSQIRRFAKFHEKAMAHSRDKHEPAGKKLAGITSTKGIQLYLPPCPKDCVALRVRPYGERKGRKKFRWRRH